MKKILKIIVTLIIILSLYFIYSYNSFKNRVISKTEKIVIINKWDNLKNLAEKLDINYYFLKQYLKDKDFKLLAWRFKIPKNSNIETIIKSLWKPLPEKQVSITILEWRNIYDIDNYLTKNWYISKWSYIKYVTNPKKIIELSKFYDFLEANLSSLEWYLYPDTYTLKYPLKINELVIKQLDNFEKKVYPELKQLTNKEIYSLLILASIVEKEEKNSSQKAIVAWILKKRLNNNWPIWADITVCYPHKLTSQECKMVISKYIKEKSDYNTRTMIWLPKTPIWNPSLETILATLNSKKTKYWYYLHNIKTWKIYYAEDNKEHEENKRKFLYK